ncbi:MAG: cysteine desulfurase [Candidatus Omnitrophica bacterium]|nr:cysteine desulfurase [Candidatus Omnitrophota bacterium]
MNIAQIRRDFPILHQQVHGHPLVYLDNAATTQKPRQVLDALENYYTQDNANIHRGVHTLSERATASYETSRQKVQDFLGAQHAHEIVFVRGATEAINLVAHSLGRSLLRPGDEILITEMEHHSNIVPWQILRDETGVKLRIVPFDQSGTLLLDEFDKALNEKTKLVSVVHLSNSLGTINPIEEIIQRAHARGIPVLIDGAQSAPHFRVNVRELDCDFFVLSGHKLYGPTGIGVLYAKTEWLDRLPPYQGGGDMIRSVSFEKTTYNDLPYKFEAGTPNIAGSIGLGAAVDYLKSLGLEAIAAHESELLQHATARISALKGVRLIGTAEQKAGVLSFVIEGAHAHDVGTILDQEGIAIRSGHHCTQPVMDHYGIPASARASFGLYNTVQEIDALVRGIQKVSEVFA